MAKTSAYEGGHDKLGDSEKAFEPTLPGHLSGLRGYELSADASGSKAPEFFSEEKDTGSGFQHTINK